MPDQEKQYDVAISFLVQDLSFAQALRDRLSESLEVFFFPHNQEELAGTDGLESMRIPFLSSSRVTVVIFRERWGHTPWTRVEETAIKEGCLDHGWNGLFFYMIDESIPPTWLPRTHVRFNASDFALEQAVGAIKARVQEQGGQPQPLTPEKRAQIYQQNEQYRIALSSLNSSQGIGQISNSLQDLFNRLLERSNACGLKAEETKVVQQNVRNIFIVSGDRAAIQVSWEHLYGNTLDRSGLFVLEFEHSLNLPSEMEGRRYWHPPEPVSKLKFMPTLSRALEHGWKGTQQEFISNSRLAEMIIVMLYDRMDKVAHAAM